MTGTPRVPPPPPPPPDLAQVLGVGVAPGNAQLVVTWTAVSTATGYTVQWTSGGEDYNTGDRQATGHVGVAHALHDSQPHQRHPLHGAGDCDPNRRHRRPAVGGGDGEAESAATATASASAATSTAAAGP